MAQYACRRHKTGAQQANRSSLVVAPRPSEGAAYRRPFSRRIPAFKLQE